MIDCKISSLQATCDLYFLKIHLTLTNDNILSPYYLWNTGLITEVVSTILFSSNFSRFPTIKLIFFMFDCFIWSSHHHINNIIVDQQTPRFFDAGMMPTAPRAQICAQIHYKYTRTVSMKLTKNAELFWCVPSITGGCFS